tara:strand:- start:254 stop:1216 length:963 start_codon:yes stop_codon:yes gene_type:complete
MKPKNCLIFGASGQIGKSLIRRLTQSNYRVTAITRNYHKKGLILKTQGNAGYIDVKEANIFDSSQIESLISETDICINLIGILFESGKVNSFKNIHTKIPFLISKLCKEKKIDQLIHVSALGIESSIESKYSKSKLEGEKEILKNFENATILRPSLVYSVEDSFTTRFMSLLNFLPLFPIYYNGKTKFKPIFCSDLTEIIFKIVDKNIKNEIIECVGPEELSFKEIIKILSDLIDKKNILIPLPIFFAKLSAHFFQLLPNPILTTDQLKLLKYDSIPSGNYKTNFDMKLYANSNFKKEVSKYCYMWKKGGQFSVNFNTKN